MFGESLQAEVPALTAYEVVEVMLGPDRHTSPVPRGAVRPAVERVEREPSSRTQIAEYPIVVGAVDGGAEMKLSIVTDDLHGFVARADQLRIVATRSSTKFSALREQAGEQR